MENVLDPIKPTEVTVSVTGRSTDSKFQTDSCFHANSGKIFELYY